MALGKQSLQQLGKMGTGKQLPQQLGEDEYEGQDRIQGRRPA